MKARIDKSKITSKYIKHLWHKILLTYNRNKIFNIWVHMLQLVLRQENIQVYITSSRFYRFKTLTKSMNGTSNNPSLTWANNEIEVMCAYLNCCNHKMMTNVLQLNLYLAKLKKHSGCRPLYQAWNHELLMVHSIICFKIQNSKHCHLFSKSTLWTKAKKKKTSSLSISFEISNSNMQHGFTNVYYGRTLLKAFF
jgi:hypothetical protein